ncbi:MAG: PorT family protein [Cyclobacteriaceae bacterium]|nr:PorT family protein [Cyclobacteriaceae bacterium]
MIRLRLTVVVLFAACSGLYAQVQSTCAQKIRQASSVYEQGRLHELEGILKECVSSPNKQEQVQAFKLLTLSYIYLEEPEKADEAMLNLLNADPFFEVNPDVDPAEFIALYGKFRTKPLFRVAFRGGANASAPALVSDYYVASAAPGNGKYKPGYGFQAGLTFEKDFTDGPQWLRGFTLAPELMYSIRKFVYTNPTMFVNDSDPTKANTGILGNFSQSWFDVNGIVQYRIFKNNKTWIGTLNPYIGMGPGFSYLLGSAFPFTTSRDNGFTVTGANVDSKENFRAMAYSLVLTSGMKYKFGSIYLLADVRVQIGLSNVVNADKRSNAVLVRDYGYTFPDYRQNTLSFTVGLQYPYFNPKKLIK